MIRKQEKAVGKRSKGYRGAADKVDSTRTYLPGEALEACLAAARAKFDETVEASFRLGVDPKRSDQTVRGTVLLPHGSGRKVRVLVLAKGAGADEAREAEADEVGLEEMIEKISKGWTEFDAVVTAPEYMREVGKLGRILGPRGLMPSPKAGTVTQEIGRAVREIKAGKVEFKLDKGANLHIPIGKVSFGKEKLLENFRAALDAVTHARPAAAKGQFIRNCAFATTMGPGVRVETKAIS